MGFAHKQCQPQGISILFLVLVPVILLVLLYGAMFTWQSMSSFHQLIPDHHPELVLHENTRLIANTPQGTLEVIAGKGIERVYQWNECSLTSHMRPRFERWYGQLGIYDPAPSDPVTHFFQKKCQGLSRTVVQEGQLHFRDLQSARQWLKNEAHITPSLVWSPDGLVLSWRAYPGRVQFNADLIMVCIDGQRPTTLPGGKEDIFKIVANPSGLTVRDCASVEDSVYDETQTQLDGW